MPTNLFVIRIFKLKNKRINFILLPLFALILPALGTSSDINTENYITFKDGKNILALNSYINDSIKHGIKDIELPKGRYYIDKGVSLYGKKDLIITGSGNPEDTVLISDVMNQNPLYCFFSNNTCTNLTFKNFTIDYDPLPFTQGTVTKVFPKEKAFIVKIHKGYPDINNRFIKPKTVNFYDPLTRLFKKGIPTNFFDEWKILSPRTVRISKPYHKGYFHNLQVGDLAVFTSRLGVAVFRSDFCDGMTIKNITIYTGPSLAIGTYHSKGKFLYQNIKITRGPTPERASQQRLLSTTADGCQHRYCLEGPIIENCDWGFMCDDAVNLSSFTWPIIKVIDPKNIIVGVQGTVTLKMQQESLDTDSKAVFIDTDKHNRIIDEVLVKSIKTLKKDDSIVSEKVKQDWRVSPERMETFKYYQVEFSKEIPAQIKQGDGLYLSFANSENFIIRNNYFHDLRANGLRIQTSHGLIENNRIERTTYAAIALTQQMDFWKEAGWTDDIIIRNNQIKDAGLIPAFTSSSYSYLGAISVRAATTGKLSYDNFAPCHKNITITGNTIDGCSAGGIGIFNADNVIITNNTIKNVNLSNCELLGADYNLYAPYAISALFSKNVIIKNNEFSDLGKYCKAKVKISNSAPVTSASPTDVKPKQTD